MLFAKFNLRLLALPYLIFCQSVWVALGNMQTDRFRVSAHPPYLPNPPFSLTILVLWHVLREPKRLPEKLTVKQVADILAQRKSLEM